MGTRVNEQISVEELKNLVGFKGPTDLGEVEVIRESDQISVSVTRPNGHDTVSTVFHIDARGRVRSSRVNVIKPGEYDGIPSSVEPAAGSVGEVIQAVNHSKGQN